MKRLHVRFAIAAVALCGLTTPARAQNHVVVQAEDFVSTSDVGGSPGFLTMMDDPMATGGGTPGYIKTGRDYTAFPPEVLANYGIDFPTTDPYHLYVRGLAEGADGGNDSLWVANGFGSPAPDFYRTNNWSGPSGGDWVWLNLTQNTTLGPPSAGGGVELLDSALVATTAGPFTPASLSGNQFEVGGREDGFRVDAYVFSTEDSLSADQLDKLIGLPTIVGGEGTIGRPKFGAFKNLTFQPAEDIEGVVQFEFRGVNNDGYQFANRAEYETFAAATPPDISGIMAAPILWQNGNYPAEWEPSVATNGDVEDYSVTITGQIFINETFKDFKAVAAK